LGVCILLHVWDPGDGALFRLCNVTIVGFYYLFNMLHVSVIRPSSSRNIFARAYGSVVTRVTSSKYISQWVLQVMSPSACCFIVCWFPLSFTTCFGLHGHLQVCRIFCIFIFIYLGILLRCPFFYLVTLRMFSICVLFLCCFLFFFSCLCVCLLALCCDYFCLKMVVWPKHVAY
jgi:hypothetical protein